MRSGEASDKAATPALEKGGLARVAYTLLGMTAMVFLVKWLGLATSILMFLLYLTLVVQRLAIGIGIGASLGTVVFVYVVFVHFLGVPIPEGPLGF